MGEGVTTATASSPPRCPAGVRALPRLGRGIGQEHDPAVAFPLVKARIGRLEQPSQLRVGGREAAPWHERRAPRELHAGQQVVEPLPGGEELDLGRVRQRLPHVMAAEGAVHRVADQRARPPDGLPGLLRQPLSFAAAAAARFQSPSSSQSTTCMLST